MNTPTGHSQPSSCYRDEKSLRLVKSCEHSVTEAAARFRFSEDDTYLQSIDESEIRAKEHSYPTSMHASCPRRRELYCVLHKSDRRVTSKDSPACGTHDTRLESHTACMM